MSDHSVDLVVFVIVVGLRLFVPLLIPRFPIPAGVAALLLDAADQTIFQNYTDLNLDNYQSYDKALDIYYLTIIYLSTMRNWTHLWAFEVSRFLYFYRLVGVVLFETFDERWLLLVFPNTFEYFFLFYEGVRLRWNPLRMSRNFVLGAAAFIWIFIKLPQEWWIHIAQLDTTDLIKEDIFGATSETPWGDIVSDNVGVFVGLAIALVLLVLAIRWYVKNRLPPADWAFSFDADAHETGVTAEGVRAAARARRGRIFDRDLVEKVVMVSLIFIIFGHVLPDVQSSNLELIIGVVVLIAINTALSEWFARRGVEWRSLVRQFFAMAIANAGVALAFYLLLRSDEGSIRLGNTLFFLFLLTLLVVLYDAFRPYYLARTGLAPGPTAGEAVDDAPPLPSPAS